MIAIALLLAAAAHARPPSFGPVFGGAAATGSGVTSVIIDPTDGGAFADPGTLLSSISHASGITTATLTCDGTNRDGVAEGASWTLDGDDLAAQGHEIDWTASSRWIAELEIQADSAHVVGMLLSVGPASLNAGALFGATSHGYGVPNATNVWPIYQVTTSETSAGAWYAHVLGTDGAITYYTYWEWDPAGLGWYTAGYSPTSGGMAGVKGVATGTTNAAQGIVVGLGCYTGTATGVVKFKVTLHSLPMPE